ncbi:MAG: branched-chain amino acid ABC transporter permease [Candidatus Tectimicrobiota bacterium]|nr:MAG: branched-chain amino acid ABC transporter permease [Candidatus Tectomicrobia bacterium]
MRPLPRDLLLLGLCLVLAVLPVSAAPQYVVSLVLFVFMFIALAESWNLLSGYTGYVSFGHVVFFGVGAYTTAITMTRWGLAWLPASLLGGVAAVGLALLIGYPCLRLKGPYFAISMLGLSEVVRLLALYLEPLTGGGMGISRIRPPTPDPTPVVYWAMEAMAVLVVAVTYAIDRAQFGLRLKSIREDELAAEAMGINTTAYKMYAFLLSAFFPGIVGGIHAYYLSYIEPDSTFALLYTINMAIMTIFGGRGTVWGPVIGAVTLYLVSEAVWVRFPFLHLVLFGLVIMIVVLFMPRGVLGWIATRRPRLVPAGKEL